MQRAARLTNIRKSLKYVVRLVAVFVLLIAAFPDSASCAANFDMHGMTAHSCCAPSASACESAVISNGCCCKAAPIDRAASPGLIATSTTPFFAVTVLPRTPLPSMYQVQYMGSRDNILATVSPPKKYIVYRALLI